MNQDIHTPRHLLETLAVDPDPAHAPEARRHVAECRACTSRLEEIARARAAYLAAYPAADFARQVAARAERARRATAAEQRESEPRDSSTVSPWRRRRLVGGLVLALGGVALFAFVRPATDAPDEIRLKGGASLSVFAQRGARTWPVSDGETLRPGDRLAFAYGLSQDRYLLLLGIDDAGIVLRYGPDAPAPLRLAKGQGRVPFAIELDARPGEEQLVALFSRAPLDVAVAKQALAAVSGRARAENRHVTAGDLNLPAEIVTFGFQKL